MTEEAIVPASRRRRQWRRIGWAGAVAAILFPLWVVAATDPTDNIALSRNEVVRSGADGPTWRGTFWNHSDSLYTDLEAVVLFLDAEGRPVGQARGGAERLDPGEVFHLRAPLPGKATQMQIYQLRWTTYGKSAVLGPYRAWPFGHVTDQACGDLRLAIGSCTPMREQEQAS